MLTEEKLTKPNPLERIPPERRGLGRPKGVPNKFTMDLKQAILQAGQEAHPGGLVSYLVHIAQTQPVAFCGLLGKVLPMQVTGQDGGALEIRWLPPKD